MKKFLFLKILSALFFLSLLPIIGVFFIYYLSLPKIDNLGNFSGQIIHINYSNNQSLATRSDIAQSEIRYYELPENLIKAVLAIEDRKFFSHSGVDIFAIIRAFYANRQAGRVVQGGSTITQQLAKMLFLNPQRNIHRKIQEVMLAWQLERKFSKEEILTFYLNHAYFGAGNYGIGNAAKGYFGKDVSKLNLYESALLAGLLKAPSKISPKNNPKLAKQRAKMVLGAMQDAGFLDEKGEVAQDQQFGFLEELGLYNFAADYVVKQLDDVIDKDANRQKLINVKTSLDQKIQNDLEKLIAEFSQKNAEKLGSAEIATVVMRKDGAILAISGGLNYQNSQFNRAIYAKRQAGSAFKTFVYLAAFENGFSPDDIFNDKKVSFGKWLPDNYEGKYLGEVTLRQAFAGSLNSVAAQLSQKLGGKEIAKIARICGIISPINYQDLTISLGTTEVSLLEMVGAYATIANNGAPIIPYFIEEVSDNEQKIIFNRQASRFDEVISSGSLKGIKDLLREVVVSGTGKKANVSNKIYGKTGTSQNFRDAWFIGFDDEKVIGVWIGNDDNSPTNKITGGSLPAELFAEIYDFV